jgi:hypothetical protein
MQQVRYLEAMPDVMNYATNALSAIDYVEPHVNDNTCIVYPQLFDEQVYAMFFLFCTFVFYVNKLNLLDSVCCYFFVLNPFPHATGLLCQSVGG